MLNDQDVKFVFGNLQNVVDSFLPSCLLKKQVENKKVVKASTQLPDYEGKVFYMVPWSLHVNENNEYFIDMSNSKSEKKFGTLDMKVVIKDGMAEVYPCRGYKLNEECFINRSDISKYKHALLVSKLEFTEPDFIF